MPEYTRITDQNRRAWDEIAEVRASRWREKHPDELFQRGRTVLANEVRAAAGDVTGRRLLHLQCASGEETLSWAALGAQATGIDISDRCIMLARERATALGLDVRFVAADVYALPADLTGFDVVYTGGGALVWLPELEEWARAVHRALAPSGTLLLAEEHPVATCLMIERGAIRVADDYFQRGRVVPGPPGWSHFDDRGIATEPKYEFVWPLRRHRHGAGSLGPRNRTPRGVPNVGAAALALRRRTRGLRRDCRACSCSLRGSHDFARG